MAKAKTVWRYRAHDFQSKKDLLIYLRQLAQDGAYKNLGLQVHEVRGEDSQNYSVRIKVQVLLGPWPPRNRKQSAPAAAAPAKRLRLKPPEKPSEQEYNEYFGEE